MGRRDELEDILGDADACSDFDCPCKRRAAEARDELRELDRAEEVNRV